MKKVILFVAILFSAFSVMGLQAQEVTPDYGTKQSTLTLRLKPFLALSVEGSSLIEYETKNHYTNGTFVDESDKSEKTKVTVSSAGSFSVSVEATDLIETGVSGNVLPAENIYVTATHNGKAVKNDNAETTLEALKGGAPLISAANGGLDMVYNLSFRANGGEIFRQAYNNGSTTEGIQDYVTTITYTIAVQ